MENLEEISLLLDFYGELLPEKQLQFLRLYHEENCSLAEIALEFGVSRQGVYDAVKKAQSALLKYEEKLQLSARQKENEAAIAACLAELQELSCVLQNDKPAEARRLNALGESLKKMVE